MLHVVYTDMAAPSAVMMDAVHTDVAAPSSAVMLYVVQLDMPMQLTK